MARPLRICYPGALYHVTARGNERRPIVRDDEDRQRFVRTLAGIVDEYEVRCHAWVLMDNHYHLVLATPLANLSSAVRHLNSTYSQAFNRRHERVGHLFQGRYSGILIDRDAYFLNVCRYVVLNPVRAAAVSAPAAWAWSSYRATVGEAPCPPWLAADAILEQFGSTRAAAQASYRRFVDDRRAAGVPIWDGVRGQAVLGSEAFLEEAKRRSGHLADPDLISLDHRSPGAEPVVSLETILNVVGSEYGVPPRRLLEAGAASRDARTLAIYGARRHARLSMDAIAAAFGMSASGASRRYSAAMARLEADDRFRARAEACFVTSRPDPHGKT